MRSPVDSTAADALVRALLPLFRSFSPGPVGIAIGGAHAKGRADALSDVDVHLFARDVLPGARRRELVAQALGQAAGATSWGEDEPFTQCGTDFLHGRTRVECWLRGVPSIDAAVAASLEGRVGRTQSVWAVMGFFDHVVLGDLRSMWIVEDPRGDLARWKEATRTYPAPLRRALLDRFTAEAAFWPRNPHYLTAVERGDAIYAAAIVQQVVQSLVQVVFALNRAYFPGEKGLAAALEKLPLPPDGLAARLDAILFPGRAPDVRALRAQNAALAALVDEIGSMVEEDRGMENG